MSEFWETAFTEKQMMWGLEPARSALFALDLFAAAGAEQVLIPGVGYGRNARPFLERGMAVTGIEISETAIALARAQPDVALSIYHGSVTDMPYDSRQYDGIFCYGLIHLLDAAGRAKLIRDCYRQLAPGGQMVFSVVSKEAPMYGRGTLLEPDWYESLPGLTLYFYDADSVQREFGAYGLVEVSKIDEPTHGGSSIAFLNVVCKNVSAGRSGRAP